MSPNGLYVRYTLITLEVRYRYDIGTLLIGQVRWTYVGIKMYRTASVLIACEYRTSKVFLAYLQRIWTSWRMPDTEYTVHKPTYAGMCGHSRSKTLLIGSIRYVYTQFCIFKAFCAYEKYFMNFNTQLLRFSHTQQCDRAIKYLNIDYK